MTDDGSGAADTRAHFPDYPFLLSENGYYDLLQAAGSLRAVATLIEPGVWRKSNDHPTAEQIAPLVALIADALDRALQDGVLETRRRK